MLGWYVRSDKQKEIRLLQAGEEEDDEINQCCKWLESCQGGEEIQVLLLEAALLLDITQPLPV